MGPQFSHEIVGVALGKAGNAVAAFSSRLRIKPGVEPFVVSPDAEIEDKPDEFIRHDFPSKALAQPS